VVNRSNDKVAEFPPHPPRLSAMIRFVVADRRSPLVETGVHGDSYYDLEIDAVKQIEDVLEINVKHGLVHKHVVYNMVMVCATGPDGTEYCLPTTFNGKIEQIIEAAKGQLYELFHELYIQHAAEDPEHPTLIEQSRVQAEAIVNLMRRATRAGRG
jgi:hypothetical protein